MKAHGKSWRRWAAVALAVGIAGTDGLWGGWRAPVARAATAMSAANEAGVDWAAAWRDAARFAVPAVDARVDRVWHAIPGLMGWRLDEEASRRQTEAARDGRVHWVWRAVPPRVRLADLPPKPVYRGPAAERAVCLMFNVSWGEDALPSILNTLAEKRVRATFFLDGAFVRKHPDWARAIAAAGHAVGSHGTGHPDFRRLANSELARQVQVTNRIIREVTGVTPRLLAPPAGAYDQRTVEMARAAGMYTILWTADTIDWRRPPARVIRQRAVHGAEPGALILMHPTQPTAAALPGIIDDLRQRGFCFKTVDDVISEVRCGQPPAGP
ncbi:hypothetical protein GCM10010885_12340 [Alicyclobacillus cellulosilyticus]|uniref:NodB homology domain-containing protein n=1 Tax=Alicyclobacillus cellulosilyticus TaxID=1003997 RepID=A0A917NJ44_9BACL|nr:polysaccharide deacetylase family protein [Alicyclobacillus cellulosilyticus]GGJ04706.1 hypothetical protein GCM10010885_12340 [Alicyclobacillus cellulosilyticus]